MPLIPLKKTEQVMPSLGWSSLLSMSHSNFCKVFRLLLPNAPSSASRTAPRLTPSLITPELTQAIKLPLCTAPLLTTPWALPGPGLKCPISSYPATINKKEDKRKSKILHHLKHGLPRKTCDRLWESCTKLPDFQLS